MRCCFWCTCSRETTPEEQQQQQGLADMQSPASMSTCSSAHPSALFSPLSDMQVAATPAASAIDHEEMLCSQACARTPCRSVGFGHSSLIRMRALPHLAWLRSSSLNMHLLSTQTALHVTGCVSNKGASQIHVHAQASNGDLAPVKLAAQPPNKISQALEDTITTFNDRLHEVCRATPGTACSRAWDSLGKMPGSMPRQWGVGARLCPLPLLRDIGQSIPAGG